MRLFLWFLAVVNIIISTIYGPIFGSVGGPVDYSRATYTLILGLWFMYTAKEMD